MSQVVILCRDMCLYMCFYMIHRLVEVRSVGSLIVSRVDRCVIVLNIVKMTLLGPGHWSHTRAGHHQCQCQLTNVSWCHGQGRVGPQWSSTCSRTGTLVTRTGGTHTACWVTTGRAADGELNAVDGAESVSSVLSTSFIITRVCTTVQSCDPSTS